MLWKFNVQPRLDVRKVEFLVVSVVYLVVAVKCTAEALCVCTLYSVHVQCTVNECVPCGMWSVSQAIIGTITAAYSAQYMSVCCRSVSDRCLQSTTVYGRSVCVVGHPVVSDTPQDAIVCRLCHLLHVTLCKPVQCTTPQCIQCVCVM